MVSLTHTHFFLQCFEVVKALIEAGVDVNKCEKRLGMSPIYVASEGGFTRIVSLLLKVEGIDVNRPRTDNSTTCLMMAVKGRHLDVIRLLLEVDGIEVNAQGVLGMTALYMSCELGFHDVVELLLQRDDVDANLARTDNGATPLLMAVSRRLRLSFFLSFFDFLSSHILHLSVSIPFAQTSSLRMVTGTSSIHC